MKKPNEVSFGFFVFLLKSLLWMYHVRHLINEG